MSAHERQVFLVEYDGARLDAFLAEKLSMLSRSHVQGLIEEGLVTVNGADQMTRAGRFIVLDWVNAY